MRVLITGGAGFIGSHLAEALLQRGEEVLVLDNLSTGMLGNISHLKHHPAFRLVVESVCNEKVTEDVVKEADLVFHLAASVGVRLVVQKSIETIETNVFGTHILLRLCHRYGKKIILSSTSEVYGKREQVPFKEDDDRIMGTTSQRRWAYACSKALDEYMALAYWYERGLPVIIIRFFNIIGPRQIGRYGMVVPSFVRQALLSEPLTVFGDGRQSRSFTYIEDAVEGILGLAHHSQAIGGVFNLGNTEEITIEELAKLVKEKAASPSPICYVPYKSALGEDFEDIRRRIPDISKIRELIGYSPKVSLDKAIERIIQYHRSKTSR